MATSSSSQEKSEAEVKPTLRILVVGKTGAGKSSLVNALLDEAMFEEHFGPEVGTKDYIQGKQVDLNGVDVHGFDTRGFFDYEVDKNTIITAIDEVNCDFDIVLVCMKFTDRLDESNKRVFEILAELKNVSNIWNKMVVVLTNSDVTPPQWKEGIDGKVEEVRCNWASSIHEFLVEKLELSEDNATKIPTNISTHVEKEPLPGHLLGWLEKLFVTIAEKACVTPEAMLALAATSERNVVYALKAIADKVGMEMPLTLEDAKAMFRAMCNLVGKGHEMLDRLSRLVIDEIKTQSSGISNIEEIKESNSEEETKESKEVVRNQAQNSSNIGKVVVAGGGAGGAAIGAIGAGVLVAFGAPAAVIAVGAGGGLVLGIAIAAWWLWKNNKKEKTE